jgi:hypothetical protein
MKTKWGTPSPQRRIYQSKSDVPRSSQLIGMVVARTQLPKFEFKEMQSEGGKMDNAGAS